jgi:negative regulator of flagellin synthesis FlgM
MKIGQPSEILPAAAHATQSAAARTASGEQPAVKNERRAPAGVGVTMSTLARRLDRTRSTDAPEVDMEKVKAVRQAIAQKTYVVNPEAIADKLLANAQEMLNRTKS